MKSQEVSAAPQDDLGFLQKQLTAQSNQSLSHQYSSAKSNSIYIRLFNKKFTDWHTRKLNGWVHDASCGGVPVSRGLLKWTFVPLPRSKPLLPQSIYFDLHQLLHWHKSDRTQVVEKKPRKGISVGLLWPIQSPRQLQHTSLLTHMLI